jgi:uncharacterized paraquat-inducible protein A
MKKEKPYILIGNDRWIKFKCESCKLHFKIDAFDILDSYALYETAKCPRCSKYVARTTPKVKDVDFIADF